MQLFDQTVNEIEQDLSEFSFYAPLIVKRKREMREGRGGKEKGRKEAWCIQNGGAGQNE